MTQQICVASVPAAHPYVERVTATPTIRVLADPQPVGAPAGQWWPPVVLGPSWIGDHEHDAQLLHIHFGTESFAPGELVAAVETAHRAGWPVVQTVHDLVHPQLSDQAPYLEQLEALLPIVDAVVTLTPGAAREIERRFDRRAIVLPHPRLLDDDVVPPRGLVHDVPVVGVHLKDLRPNVDGIGAVEAMIHAIDLLAARGRRLTGEVHLHRQVRDVSQRDSVRGLCARRDDVVLVEHERYDDTGLAHALARLDVCILPYRSGTHSGWLELCWDLGVPVAAPSTGFFAEQHDDPTVASFTWDADGRSLAAALDYLTVATPASGTAERQRLVEQRQKTRAVTDARTVQAHVDLYRRVLAERGRTATSEALS